MSLIDKAATWPMLAAYYFYVCMPGALFAGLGWWLSGKLSSIRWRSVVRAGLLSLAFAPGGFLHGFPVPALWFLFFDMREKLVGTLSITAVWAIGILITAFRGRVPRRAGP